MPDPEVLAVEPPELGAPVPDGDAPGGDQPGLRRRDRSERAAHARCRRRGGQGAPDRAGHGGDRRQPVLPALRTQEPAPERDGVARDRARPDRGEAPDRGRSGDPLVRPTGQGYLLLARRVLPPTGLRGRARRVGLEALPMRSRSHWVLSALVVVLLASLLNQIKNLPIETDLN